MAFIPVLSFIQTAKILENSTDYSLQNTTRQALLLPTSREIKYKAKAAIDTFFVRTGDVLSAGIVFLGSYLLLNAQAFAAVNVGLIIAWLAFVIMLGRHYRKFTLAQVETLT
jgi:AAA family ATP:ADP antiporter